MISLTTAEIDQLYKFTSKAQDTGQSKFPGMSYEDGIVAVLDVLEGNATIEDAIGENE